MPVHGRVLNEKSNEWIKDARVERVPKPPDHPNNLLGIKRPLLDCGITGCYFAYGPDGTYEIKVSAEGYQEKTVEVQVSLELVPHDIKLSPLF